jgi:hypothetical protein
MLLGGDHAGLLAGRESRIGQEEPALESKISEMKWWLQCLGGSILCDGRSVAWSPGCTTDAWPTAPRRRLHSDEGYRMRCGVVRAVIARK